MWSKHFGWCSCAGKKVASTKLTIGERSTSGDVARDERVRSKAAKVFVDFYVLG